jgi:long-chain acyl-CoA synthetase
MNTLKELIEKSVVKNSEKVFLTDCGLYYTKKLTYGEVYTNSLKACSFFKKKGIKKGDKVVIYFPNSSDYVSLLFACALSGVIAVPVDFNSDPEFAEKIAKITACKIIFCSVFKQPSRKNLFFVEEFSEIYNSFNKSKLNEKIKLSDVFEIVYTSGTTSEPKGVVLTQENLAFDVVAMTKSITFNTKNLSMLSILPLSHLFEQNLGLFSPMLLGARISYISSKKSSEILNAIHKQRVNAIVSVPFFIESLKSKIIANVGENPGLIKRFFIKNKFGKLKYFIVGGSALSLETERFWGKLGFWILQGYGLTETSPVLTCNSTKNYREGTVGRALEGIELKIENKEILVHGKNVFREYYKNPHITKEVKKRDWFFTGDLGEFDSGGFLKLTGRKKNVIISSSGLNIYPEDIEAVLNKIPSIKESVVLGLDDGKNLVGVVLSDSKLNVDEIKRVANKSLNSSQQIFKIVLWSGKDFPRTPTLKIIRREVEKGIISGPDSSFLSKDLLKNIVSFVCGCSVDKIKENIRLVDLGLDSIKRIELVNKIEESFNIEFDEQKINEKTTISMLRKEIENPQKASYVSNINFMNSKFFNPVRFLLQWISFIGLRVFYSIHVEGKENLPRETCILIANHTSMLDTFALYRGLPVKYRINTCPAAAKDFFFKNKIVGFLGKMTFNVFGFSRKEEIKQSLRDFGELINRGMNVLIYPEGTRSRTGKLAEFKDGIGVIAWNISLPVVPIKIEGLREILPVGNIWPRRGKVRIKIGKPIQFNRMNSPQVITKKLHKIVEEM